MDNVKHPDHYCKGGIECIDAIKAAISNINDPYEAYCTGNIIKYAWRWSGKNGTEDLNKLIQYAEFIKEHREDCDALDIWHMSIAEMLNKLDIRDRGKKDE